MLEDAVSGAKRELHLEHEETEREKERERASESGDCEGGA